ncbi:hypothetical protein ACL6C3_24355 [Capilliphycus salinus ALCB114379]|uniref:hypothetical protein n=1 Tax=Capilliphycus salinus TaxID=2768948 RepID=UPI0039A65105
MDVEIYVLVDTSTALTKVDVFLSEPDAILEKNKRENPTKVEIFKKTINAPIKSLKLPKT